MLAEPECSKRRCKHFVGIAGNELDNNEVCVCAAFPDGIPHEISYGKNKHLKPYEGDNGIQYEEETGDA